MYPIRKLVDEENSLQFDQLKTPIHVYTAVDMQSSPDGTPDLKSVLKDLQAPMGLKLRVGAQVMWDEGRREGVCVDEGCGEGGCDSGFGTGSTA
jgi:hypothetical protein